MVSLIPRGTDLVGGLELGGDPLATVVSQLNGMPTLFVRKRAKEYGTERLAEGVIDIAGRRVTLIEDVITTGGAVRQAALSLRAQGAEVASVACAIDRSDGLPSALDDLAISVHPVLGRSDLDAVHQRGWHLDRVGSARVTPRDDRPAAPTESGSERGLGHNTGN